MKTLTGFLLLLLSVLPADRAPYLQSSLQGNDQLTVSGRAQRGMLLGVSFYTSSGQARHALYPLGDGLFRRRLVVGARFREGSYQLALWRAKVPASQCQVPQCAYCPVYGYHLDGKLAGTSGYFTLGFSSLFTR